MRALLGLIRAVVALLIVLTAAPAILALLGDWVPVLDLFNHLQLLLFFGTLASAVAALLFAMRRWLQILAVLGVVASGWTFGPEWLSSLQPRQQVSDVATLKVMTHNLFGLNLDMQRVAGVIADEDPDIIALQEYFPEQSRLDSLLKPTYPFSVRCQGGKRANIALYSKIPFDREMRDADCPDNAYGTQRTAHIIAGFSLSDGTHFSLMTTHMDWPFPIERQADEFAAAATDANAVTGPLLVVGDFNSTPWSAAMKHFEAATGLRRETRNLITYPELFTVPHRVVPDGLARTIPFLPLDQVFGRSVAVSEIGTGPQTGSDHLPVIFTFSVDR